MQRNRQPPHGRAANRPQGEIHFLEVAGIFRQIAIACQRNRCRAAKPDGHRRLHRTATTPDNRNSVCRGATLVRTCNGVFDDHDKSPALD